MSNAVMDEINKRRKRASASRGAYIAFLTEKFGLNEQGDFNDIDLDKLNEQEKQQYEVLKETYDMDKAKLHAISELAYDNANPDIKDKVAIIDHKVEMTSQGKHSILCDAISREDGTEYVRIGNETIELPSEVKNMPVAEQIEYYKKLVKDVAVPGQNGVAKDVEFSKLCDQALSPEQNKEKKGIDFEGLTSSDEEFASFVDNSDTKQGKEKDLEI